jgi:hypothetical protein
MGNSKVKRFIRTPMTHNALRKNMDVYHFMLIFNPI